MSDKRGDRQYGPQYKLIGKDYVTSDLYVKVTGKSRYAEDFRAEGMLFCKLLLSPLPHARVRRIDAGEAGSPARNMTVAIAAVVNTPST
jgi:CO/xanthine dehydrogenase Mo-binding subunit